MHESGLVEKWKLRWWPKDSLCQNVKTAAKPIELADVQSAFYVLLS